MPSLKVPITVNISLGVEPVPEGSVIIWRTSVAEGKSGLLTATEALAAQLQERIPHDRYVVVVLLPGETLEVADLRRKLAEMEAHR